MNLHFMRASEADIPVIYAQAKNLIDTYEDLASIDYDKVLDWVRRKISKHISSYTAVILSDKTCAYYRLCDDFITNLNIPTGVFASTQLSHANFVIFCDVFYLADFQNRGIGSEILEKCILESVNPLYLYVFSANTRAISFYEKHGFSLREKVGKTRLILNRKG